MDPEGNVLGWNKAPIDVPGCLQFEIVGKHFSILFTDEDA
jgi:hypothetical protein